MFQYAADFPYLFVKQEKNIPPISTEASIITYHGTNPDKKPRTRLKALVISGWSDGPLIFLKQRFQDQVEFHDITNQVPTPPVGLKCWCNPYLFLIFMFIVLFFYSINILLESQLQTFVKFIILCLGVAVCYIVGKRFLLAKFFGLLHSVIAVEL